MHGQFTAVFPGQRVNTRLNADTAYGKTISQADSALCATGSASACPCARHWHCPRAIRLAAYHPEVNTVYATARTTCDRCLDADRLDTVVCVGHAAEPTAAAKKTGVLESFKFDPDDRWVLIPVAWAARTISLFWTRGRPLASSTSPC